MIHTGAVKGVSDPLDAMMSNGMRESLTGVAVLEDVDVSTFAGFCEFVYSGSYKTPERKELPAPKEPEMDINPPAPEVIPVHQVAVRLYLLMEIACVAEKKKILPRLRVAGNR